MAPIPMIASAAAPKVLPVLLAVGSISIVGGYVRSQLTTQSRTFDRQFSQYNTNKSESVRAKTFDALCLTLEQVFSTFLAGKKLLKIRPIWLAFMGWLLDLDLDSDSDLRRFINKSALGKIKLHD
ncbi:unnamed protein product [Fusarium langsethiae]|nr:unnamed protein product [Fusarium langsethiae]